MEKLKLTEEGREQGLEQVKVQFVKNLFEDELDAEKISVLLR